MFKIASAQRICSYASQRFTKDTRVSMAMTKGTIISIQNTVDRAKELRASIQSRVTDIQTLVGNNEDIVHAALDVLNMCNENDECLNKLDALCDRAQQAVESGLMSSGEAIKKSTESLHCVDILNTIMGLEKCRDALSVVDIHVSDVLQQCNELFNSDQLSLLREAYADCEEHIKSGNNDGQNNILNNCIHERLLSQQRREQRKAVKIEKLLQLLEQANDMSESLKRRILQLQLEYDRLTAQCQQLTEDLTSSKDRLSKYKNNAMKQSIYSSVLAGVSVAACSKFNGASMESAATSALAAGASVGAMLYACHMNNK